MVSCRTRACCPTPTSGCRGACGIPLVAFYEIIVIILEELNFKVLRFIWVCLYYIIDLNLKVKALMFMCGLVNYSYPGYEIMRIGVIIISKKQVATSKCIALIRRLRQVTFKGKQFLGHSTKQFRSHMLHARGVHRGGRQRRCLGHTLAVLYGCSWEQCSLNAPASCKQCLLHLSHVISRPLRFKGFSACIWFTRGNNNKGHLAYMDVDNCRIRFSGKEDSNVISDLALLATSPQPALLALYRGLCASSAHPSLRYLKSLPSIKCCKLCRLIKTQLIIPSKCPTFLRRN